MSENRISAEIGFTFSKEEIALLFEACPTIRKKKNECLYHSGDIEDTIYYIQKGRFKLYTVLPDGSCRVMGYHREGATIGFVNAFSQDPSSCSCEALQDSVLLTCPVKIFWDRLKRYDLVEKFLSLEQKKVNHTFSVRAASTNSIYMVKVLLEDGLTQQEIADFLGYSRVQISRLCAQLKKEEK